MFARKVELLKKEGINYVLELHEERKNPLLSEPGMVHKQIFFKDR